MEIETLNHARNGTCETFVGETKKKKKKKKKNKEKRGIEKRKKKEERERFQRKRRVRRDGCKTYIAEARKLHGSARD